MQRYGVIGIVVEGNRDSVPLMQNLLTEYGDIIVGRMGLPDRLNSIQVISLIVKGTTEQVSALTGKLGKIESLQVKSALTQVIVD